jgi:hypothetical protein
MKIEITIEHLIMLVAILFILSFLLKAKETFEAGDQKPKSKACGQESVNYGFQHYIFDSPKTPARG